MTKNEHVFRVAPYSLPLVGHYATKNPLYPHQAEVWDRWDKDHTTLLAAKTGAGKTRAVMLPLLLRGEWGIAVYPTNELLRDQVRAVTKLAENEGIKAATWVPNTSPEEYAAAETILVPVDRRLLDDWQESTHCRYRGEALRRILDPDKPKIVFVNPDVLFNILALRYDTNALGALQRYRTLIFDEFHLYQGVELAHALVMVGMARSFHFFERLMLLSATPNPEVRTMLDGLYHPHVIEPRSAPNDTSTRIAVHAVEVTPVQLATNDPVNLMLGRIAQLKPQLQRLRAENPEYEYIPAVVIVNSVVNAISLEDELVEFGFTRDSIGIIRGLSNRAIRSTKGKLLVLGTSAIEVGIDFHCDYLLFEATDAASFMQRFGRVGRHRPGKAAALVPPNVFAGMSSLPQEIGRESFEDHIKAWYRSSDAKPWFVTTEYGMITARALTENFVRVARESGINPQTEIHLRERIDAMLCEHSQHLGCERENLQAQQMFKRCTAGKQKSQWLKTYSEMNQFRTSLTSVPVHDFTEQHKRAEWDLGEYEADLRTLLKRAVDISWCAKLDRITIKGIGKLRRVRASEIFDDGDCSVILETKDYSTVPRLLSLYQDDKPTPISDLMTQKNHIFAVVRKKDVEPDLDWRLPVFETNDYFLAFDGAALMLLEMARKGQKRPP